ncbi:MAG TPA: tyrosinase family protein [Rhodopseudomonas sp.]|uniref:tyrosinase family protein n=1 Tax=Rhodopseudomonas sp. TaxID=1078 RepID=UPI002ED98A34
MSHFSRRSLLLTSATAGLVLGAPDWLKAADQTPYTRFSATSEQGKAMLKLYAQAVTIMTTKIPKGDPRHWDFQWYSHWIPGPQSPWSAVAAKKAETLQAVYAGKPASDPNRKLAELMWDDCQAHGSNPNQPEQFQEELFLPWHRYFVYYFEQIIRGVLQNPDFALPYWNYLGGPPASTAIPEEFRNPSSSLFRANRNPGVNDGKPIDVGSGRTPLSADAFRETLYIDSPDGSLGFCPQLDGNPHGAVHVDTGNTTNMGRVPTAAGDPVFWLHHCEIDRLWESWNRLPGRPNPTWPRRTLVFANAAGGMVTAPVAGADRVALLGYQYDDYFVPPGIATAEVAASAQAAPTAQAAPSAARPLEVRAVTTAPLSLGDAPVQASLSLPAAALSGSRVTTFAASTGPRNLYLLLGGITLNADPGDVVYDVYIDLPAGAKPGPDDPHYVGTVNFFHIMIGHDHAAAATAADTGHHSTAVFNVTETVQKLQSGNQLSKQATVTLIPNGKLKSGARPVVAQVELVEK